MEKKNNAWVNGISRRLIHENVTAEGKTFANISIPYAGSKNGYLTVGVAAGQVRDAKSADFANILLGNPETLRKVSIQTRAGKKPVYKTVEMSNAQIAAAYDESRKAYKAAQAEAEAPVVADAE